MKRTPEANFARALRAVRKARSMAQEEFDQISSRTYVSALERGIKQPTLPKVDALAAVLGVHPLTLLVISYASKATPDEIQRLLERVGSEITDLEVDAFLHVEQ
jgi:transcriptional regulator with XRE-family HTH domain